MDSGHPRGGYPASVADSSTQSDDVGSPRRALLRIGYGREKWSFMIGPVDAGNETMRNRVGADW